MFNLSEIIKSFNQQYRKRVKINKTWGLFYLQFEPLAFLNTAFQLIEKTKAFGSLFKLDRKEIRAKLAQAKNQPLSESLHTLNSVLKDLQSQTPLIKRLDWEYHYKVYLDRPQTWQSIFNTLGSHQKSEQFLLEKLKIAWKTHCSFQFHDNASLLFLLYMVKEYEDHFKRALKELHEHQHSFFPFGRMPPVLAEQYKNFLIERRNYLASVHQQLIDELLLRLKAAAKYGVTCSDASYYIISILGKGKIQSHYKNPPPAYVMDNINFHQFIKAIKKYGNASQIKQLTNLSWYRSALNKGTNAETIKNIKIKIKLIETKNNLLLIPQDMISIVPKKYRKPHWLFRQNNACLEFLEDQQQLLASLTAYLPHAHYILESLSLEHPLFKQLEIRYQLLKQAIAASGARSTPDIPWYHFTRRKIQKLWQKNLQTYFYNAQSELLEWLNILYHKSALQADLLKDKNFCLKMWRIINALKDIIKKDLNSDQYQILEETIDRFAVLFKQDPISHWIAILDEIFDHSDSVSAAKKKYVIKAFKQMGLRDEGVENSAQIAPFLRELYGTKAVTSLLPLIKAHLQANHPIKHLQLEIKLVTLLGDEAAQAELALYLKPPENLSETVSFWSDFFKQKIQMIQKTIPLFSSSNEQAEIPILQTPSPI